MSKASLFISGAVIPIAGHAHWYSLEDNDYYIHLSSSVSKHESYDSPLALL